MSPWFGHGTFFVDICDGEQIAIGGTYNALHARDSNCIDGVVGLVKKS